MMLLYVYAEAFSYEDCVNLQDDLARVYGLYQLPRDVK